MAVLVDITNNNTFPLKGNLTLIGRDARCDIVDSSPMVSSRHCMILNKGNLYSIEDLGSMNGTFVNDVRLTRRTRLFPGDSISVVGLTLEFRDDTASPQPSESSTSHLSTMSVQTIGASELASAPRVVELSSIDLDGDLRLSVKPEAKLRAVLEIAKHLSESLELSVVLPQILNSLFSIFPAADCGFILLRNPQTGDLKTVATKYRRLRDDESAPVSRGIIQQVLNSGRAILSSDAAVDADIKPTDSIRHLEIRSIMCVPVNRDDGECMGVIQLDSRDRANQFNEQDLALLVCASLLAARGMDVARMHEERKELDAAKQIQRSLLPEKPPTINGVQFFDFYAAAQQVSGDYYDYIPLPNNRLAVVIGDVAGKGMSAALLMAHLAAAARICLTSCSVLSEAVGQINRLLVDTISHDRFITFVAAVLDPTDYRLTVINAGHPPPLLRHGGRQPVSVETLAAQAAGFPLGIRDCVYEEVHTTLQPGESVLLYTDGATEMRNNAGDLFGMTRLQKSVLAADGTAEDVGNAVLRDLRQFNQSRRGGDDLTMLCLGRVH
jgi:sigma-B regulation protein RsbU (phosphoserine phosphatase)